MPELRNRIKIVMCSDDISRKFVLMLHPPTRDKLSAWKGMYKYNLDDCPTLPVRQKDPVIALVIRTIRELAEQDICVAAAGIRVWPLTKGPSLWPPTLQNSLCPVKLYAFGVLYDEVPMTVPVSLLDRGAPLTADNVHVRIMGERQPLIQWLLQVPDSSMLLGSKRAAMISQRLWWSRNRKVFPLMELPAEVRAVLYRHILGSYIYPSLQSDADEQDVIVALGKRHASYYGDNILDRHSSHASYFNLNAVRIYDAQPPNLTLLRLNHQVREEALKAGWEGNTKYFVTASAFEHVIRNPYPPPYNWLTDLELSFSILQYFKMFGVGIAPDMHIDPSSSIGPLLQGITGLKTLRLRFPNPYKAVNGENPWGEFFWKTSWEVWFSTYQKQRDKERGPCHRTMVDYILSFAFPFIKHIPNVHLIGCIKTSQKKRWSHILATEYYQRKETYRTHGYDYEASLKEILSDNLSPYPVTLPPACSCPWPCSKDAITKMSLVWSLNMLFDYDDEYDISDMLEVWRELPESHPYLYKMFKVPNGEVDQVLADALLANNVEEDTFKPEYRPFLARKKERR
ncbi:hypothetical protein K491DRAFT_756472 [Lophiostoma macrostomum CBS 122681]|uniref:Uncharacterized protein n=1 Tax=Lophiostoma macrostomum CBS 122681 TaxID=1314788 RepID=A0A6A6TEX2_9PLEO|nr:hypothetical protein K491DRAFT_756472 [Lophiostoma macrostomum CBS 122681]